MFHYQIISIDKIYDSNQYNIRPFLKDEPVSGKLQDSIRTSGILHPPTLLPRKDGTYDIVCGRQRLKCAQTHFQSSKINCGLLPIKTDEETLLKILLEDQFSHSNLSIIEQSYFLDICNTFFPQKDVFQSFINSLPRGRITHGRQFLEPLINLDPKLQRDIHRSIVSEKIVGLLSSFNISDQNILADLIEKLQLGANNQKKLIGHIKDIVYRNEMPLTSLLAEDNITEIMLHPKMNTPQKATQLLTILYQMSHPLLSVAEDNFQNEIDNFKLPKHCRLTAAKSFEDDSVTLSIRFSNLLSFKGKWPDFAKKL